MEKNDFLNSDGTGIWSKSSYRLARSPRQDNVCLPGACFGGQSIAKNMQKSCKRHETFCRHDNI